MRWRWTGLLVFTLGGLALGVARSPRGAAPPTTHAAVPTPPAPLAAPAPVADVDAAVLRSALGASFALDASDPTEPARRSAGPVRAPRNLESLAMTSAAPPITLSEPPLSALGVLIALAGRAFACVRRVG